MKKIYSLGSLLIIMIFLFASHKANAQLAGCDTVNITHVSCFGGNDGAINFAFQPGCISTPVTYQWSNGATTQSISGLVAGVYTLNVLGQNGNVLFTFTYVVTQRPQLVVTLSTTKAICDGGCLHPNISGGTPGYTVSWNINPGFTGQLLCPQQPATILPPGVYIVTITDANGCTATASYNVGPCCHLICPKDTTICFNLPDSLVVLGKPTASDSTCNVDSAKYIVVGGVFGVGQTTVKWYLPGGTDTCIQIVTRNPPINVNLIWTSVPPAVAGVINICLGSCVTFFDLSTGTSNIRDWDFGDGFHSGAQNPTHCYNLAGTWVGKLTVLDACGNKYDSTFTVIVDPTPGPVINCPSVVCAGDTGHYSTPASGCIYTWTVIPPSSGTIIGPNNQQNVNVVWGAGPQGILSLTVTGCGGYCNKPTMVVIHIVPATMPVAGRTVVCQGDISDYSVECIPGNSHVWSVAPTNAGTFTGQGTCHITVMWDPNFTGTAVVCCNYQNILTGAGCSLPGACADSGCGGSTCINVQVKPVFKINGPLIVCANTLSAPFTANSGSATWKVIPPSLIPINFGSTAALNAYTWSNGTGFYKVIAYAPAGQFCNDSAMMIVQVIDVIKPVLSGPLIVCPGPKTYTYTVTPNVNNATYTYTVVGGTPATTTTTNTSIVVTWGTSGGTISVSQQTGGTPNCVSDTAALAVTTFGNISLPVVSGTNPVCNKSDGFYNYAGLPIPGATYVWSVVPATAGNITSPNGLNNVTVHWVSAGPATVKLKISLCNDDSVMYPVTVNPLPLAPVITPPSPLCAGVSGTFTGPAGMWDFGDPAGVFSAQGVNPSHTYAFSGNYNITTYVTLNGCSDTGKAVVHVDSVPPLPIVSGTSPACASGTYTYSFPAPQVFSGATYVWTISPPTLGNIISSTSNTVTIQWDAVGAITPGNIILTITSTCPVGPVSFPVSITPGPTPTITLPSPACQGAPLTFTGSAIGTWDFSPGISGPSLTAINTFSTAGTHTVKLSVTDINGCVGTTSKLVDIKPAPVASISTGDPTVYCPTGAIINTTLSALNGGGYTFNWFQTPSTPCGSGPNHTVTNGSCGAGGYYVVATSPNGCTASSNVITIVVNPTCSGGGGGPVCVPDPYTLNFSKTHVGCSDVNFVTNASGNVSNISYNFGGGTGGTTPHTYTFPGIYTVTVSGQVPGILNPGGTPCTATVSFSDTVIIPLLANFNWEYECSTGVIRTKLKDLSLAAFGNTIVSWDWYLPGNVFLVSGQNPPSQLIANGTNITLVITSSTGSVCSITIPVTVPSPVVPLFTTNSPTCVGQPISFTDASTLSAPNVVVNHFWSFGYLGATSTNAGPQYTYPIANTYSVSMTVTDLYGCTKTVTNNVNIIAPVTGTISGSLSGCGSVTLTAPCNAGYLWSNNATTASITVTNSGSYSVQALSCNGNLCPFTSVPVNVTVNPNPPALISGKIGYCPGDSIDLKTIAGAGFNYVWTKLPSTPVGSNSPNYNSDTVPGPGLHSYQVLVTDGNGCTATASVTIEVDTLPGPLIITPGDVTICQSDTPYVIQAPAGPGTFYTYLWSKTPPPNVTGTALNFNVLTTGDYSVTITTKNKCVVNIGPRKVLVNPLPPAVIIGQLVYCEHDTLILTTPPGYTYQWKFNFVNIPAATNNVLNIPNVNPTHSGNYSVVVTDPNTGCSFADTVAVIVNPVPVAPIIVANMPAPLCVGKLFQFSVTNVFPAPIGYFWNTGQTGTSVPAALAGDYYVNAVNTITGCKAKSNVLTINPTPDLSCVPTGCYDLCTECVLNDTIVIPGPDGFASYNWQVLNGAIWQNYPPSNSKDLLLTDSLCHSFRLIAFNAAGCTDTSKTLSICFHQCCDTTSVPPDTCTYVSNIFFNDIPSNLHGFGPWPPEPNVNVTISNVGSKQGQFDKYVRVVDLPGASKLEAGSQFEGKWCCTWFCWDEKIFTDSLPGVLNISPQLIIKRGTKGFIFTSVKVINENSPWTTVHAPGCPDSMPNNPTLGIWAPLTGTFVGDWAFVAANITDVVFVTDYAGGVGEITGIDNVRLIPKPLNLNCFGVPPCSATDSDGAAFVFVTDTGNCNSFRYLWSNGATTPSITGIPVGTYCVTVTNCCGCIDSCCVTILPGDSIVITDTITHVQCPDTANGAIDISVSGGTPPYNYEWSTGATVQDISGLTVGTYTVTVGCANGCVKTSSYVVSVTPQCVCNPPPPLPTISVVSNTPASCNVNGCIHVDVTGCCPFLYYYVYTSPCNPAISYAVQSTSDSTIFCNLPAGNYTLYVIDGCGRTASVTAVVASTAAPLSALVQFSTCDGPMCIQATGGCSPYTYLWSNGQTAECATFDPCHPYVVTVTDKNGCTISMSGTMPFVGFDNIIQPNCCFANGSLCAVATCFTPAPFTYLWSNGQTTQCANGLTAGSYCVTITNSIGQHISCCYTLTCIPIIVNVAVTPVACKGTSTGAINVSVTGGTGPYTYLWSTLPPQTTQTVAGLKAGTYTVTITDANGCSTTSSTTLVQAAATLVPNMSKTNIRCGGKCTGSASSLPTGGIPPYSYAWNTGAHTSGITNLCPGVYTCVITDAVGCTKTATVNITQNAPLIVVVTAFPATASATAGASGGVGPFTYLWNTVPGQTTQTASGLIAGHTYKVKVTDSKGCTKLASVTMPAPRFGNDEATQINARVYPNPTDGKLNLQFDDAGLFSFNVCLYNSIGQEAFCQTGVKEEGVTNTSYDLSTLPKGLYLLVLQTEKGNMVVKVVLE